MKGVSLLRPIEQPQLEKETLRIYEICDGCRRCFNLCPSFNTLLDAIDRVESDVTELSHADHHQVVDECYYCKLCYNHCPYTPPHQYELDFPHLMIAWKKHLAGQRGVRWRDRVLVKTDLIGTMSSLFAPIANWAFQSSWVRRLLDKLGGIHHDRQVLPYQRETFTRWWATRGKTKVQDGPRKVALFASCLVNYQSTEVGKATVQVLEKNQVQVVMPDQRCCGMPSFDTGDIAAIVKAAEANLAAFKPLLDEGYDIVVPVPSCSLMFKREYPALLPGTEAGRLAEHTFDICEYLMKLKREGALTMDFKESPGRVVYQVPCHLRDQNIGFKSKELMECAGAQVEVIERCSGHDGTWSAKTEFFQLSMNIAHKTLRVIEEQPADLLASDCPLAGLQLDQAGAVRHLDGKTTLHPIQIVRNAYGLPS